MSLSPDFEKMQELHSAIKHLNQIKAKSSEDKLDETFNAIKNINKSEISEEILNKVVDTITDGLIEIYFATSTKLFGEIKPPAQPSYRNSEIDPHLPVRTIAPSNGKLLNAKGGVDE